MPNWCNNTLTLEHEDPAMIARAKAAFLDGRLLDEFIPVPKDLHIVAGSVGAKDSPEQIALEAQEKANLEAHGYATWYDYCVNEWGTKWDVGGDDGTYNDIEGGIIVSFDSAWAPPIEAYRKLEDLGFEIKAYYFEGGMMFAGIYKDGDDDYYELEGMTASDAVDILPEDLNELFGISSSIEEYDAEENEEDTE